VRTNQIPRQIPAQEWYINPLITIAFGGLLPFGAVAVELFFILSGLWLDQIYHIFGFLFLVMIVLVVTCAEVSILLCYFQLCNEDYHWWWRSFLTSGSCAFYIMLYSFWYYLTELEMNGFVPVLIYFSYMGILSLTFFLVTGCIGYFSCLWFTHKIYGSIKVD
jgi:transmembrane 9 superfamily protein 2/4